jgi:hypothetical protein
MSADGLPTTDNHALLLIDHQRGRLQAMQRGTVGKRHRNWPSGLIFPLTLG